MVNQTLTLQKTILPKDFMVNSYLAVASLVFFGFFRSFVSFCKTYISGITSQSFVRMQRDSVLESALNANSKISSHEITNIFNNYKFVRSYFVKSFFLWEICEVLLTDESFFVG